VKFYWIFGGFWWINWISKWIAEFLEVLDLELKSTNWELDDGLTCQREHQGT
jgi:hypothetical protein